MGADMLIQLPLDQAGRSCLDWHCIRTHQWEQLSTQVDAMLPPGRTLRQALDCRHGTVDASVDFAVDGLSLPGVFAGQLAAGHDANAANGNGGRLVDGCDACQVLRQLAVELPGSEVIGVSVRGVLGGTGNTGVLCAQPCQDADRVSSGNEQGSSMLLQLSIHIAFNKSRHTGTATSHARQPGAGLAGAAMGAIRDCVSHSNDHTSPSSDAASNDDDARSDASCDSATDEGGGSGWELHQWFMKALGAVGSIPSPQTQVHTATPTTVIPHSNTARKGLGAPRGHILPTTVLPQYQAPAVACEAAAAATGSKSPAAAKEQVEAAAAVAAAAAPRYNAVSYAYPPAMQQAWSQAACALSPSAAASPPPTAAARSARVAVMLSGPATEEPQDGQQPTHGLGEHQQMRWWQRVQAEDIGQNGTAVTVPGLGMPPPPPPPSKQLQQPPPPPSLTPSGQQQQLLHEQKEQRQQHEQLQLQQGELWPQHELEQREEHGQPQEQQRPGNTLPNTRLLSQDPTSALGMQLRLQLQQQLAKQQQQEQALGMGQQDSPEAAAMGLGEKLRAQLQAQLAALQQEQQEQEVEQQQGSTTASTKRPFAAFEAYTKGIGSRLLRHMGWQEGQGLGPKQDGMAKPIEPVPRPRWLGLGATPGQKTPQQQTPQAMLMEAPCSPGVMEGADCLAADGATAAAWASLLTPQAAYHHFNYQHDHSQHQQHQQWLEQHWQYEQYMHEQAYWAQQHWQEQQQQAQHHMQQEQQRQYEQYMHQVHKGQLDQEVPPSAPVQPPLQQQQQQRLGMQEPVLVGAAAPDLPIHVMTDNLVPRDTVPPPTAQVSITVDAQQCKKQAPADGDISAYQSSEAHAGATSSPPALSGGSSGRPVATVDPDLQAMLAGHLPPHAYAQVMGQLHGLAATAAESRAAATEIEATFTALEAANARLIAKMDQLEASHVGLQLKVQHLHTLNRRLTAATEQAAAVAAGQRMADEAALAAKDKDIGGLQRSLQYVKDVNSKLTHKIQALTADQAQPATTPQVQALPPGMLQVGNDRGVASPKVMLAHVDQHKRAGGPQLKGTERGAHAEVVPFGGLAQAAQDKLAAGGGLRPGRHSAGAPVVARPKSYAQAAAQHAKRQDLEGGEGAEHVQLEFATLSLKLQDA